MGGHGITLVFKCGYCPICLQFLVTHRLYLLHLLQFPGLLHPHFPRPHHRLRMSRHHHHYIHQNHPNDLCLQLADRHHHLD
jgi:hypothetical protein